MFLTVLIKDWSIYNNRILQGEMQYFELGIEDIVFVVLKQCIHNGRSILRNG